MQSNWTETLQASFQTMWLDVSQVAPKIALALLVIVLGFIVAAILKKVVKNIANRLKLDSALSSAGVDSVVERAGYTLNTGVFIGVLVKWFVVAVFFVVALDILNLSEATAFLREVVLGFLPNVIVATIILLGATLIANAVGKSVRAAAEAAHIKSAYLLSKFAKIAIIVFAVLAALNQLNIAPELVQMLFAGIVFALALALGLAFGLGGRETAAAYLNRYTKD